MTRASTRLSSSVLLAVLLALGLAGALPASAAGNPRATGGGTTEEGGEQSTFVFNAVQHKDGTVTGQLVYHLRTADLTIHLDVDCLAIVGNRATTGGETRKVAGNTAAYPYVVVGAPAVFQVEDNGEGGDAPPDRISDLTYVQPGCQDGPPPDLPIAGNIHLAP